MDKKEFPLPIDPALPAILSELEQRSCVVVQAAPGAGKTTRLPRALLARELQGMKSQTQGEILVLEPRRLAAKVAARRVAQEIGEAVGQTVGYQFRFENVTSARTRLKFLTEGMLMRRLLSDPRLDGVQAVILDEFHERHLHTDVALAFLRHIQTTQRPELRLIVMSATLDVEGLSRYLGSDCKVFQVPGRQYEVEIRHLDRPSDRPLESQVRSAALEAIQKGQGDVLVFLPGMAEIRRCADALDVEGRREGFLVLPLHGELSKEEQDRAIRVADRPRVILSTNVAETSLTLEGVTTVIDSGLARVASYSWWSGLPSLKTRPISRASATQRAGRAGRLAPGRCLRLFTKHDFDSRAAFDVPEILRADLSQTVLELKALGLKDFGAFPWLEAPSGQALQAAEGLLYRLGAVDARGDITEIGRRIVQVPAHPRLARLVHEASIRGCLDEGASLAAALSEGDFDRGRTTIDLLADFHRVRLSERAQKVKRRLAHGWEERPGATEQALAQSILRAFPDRVARKKSASELLMSAGGSTSVDDSALVASPREYYVALDAEEKQFPGQARSRIRTRLAVPIEPEWLFDLEPSAVEEAEELLWDDQRKRVEVVSRIRYDQLILSESRQSPPSGSEQSAAAATRMVVDHLLSTPSDLAQVCDPEALVALRSRIRFLRRNLARDSAFSFPDPDENWLRDRLLELCQGCFSLGDVRQLDLMGGLTGLFSEDQRRLLEEGAPTHVTLQSSGHSGHSGYPSGQAALRDPKARSRRVPIHYEEGKPPWIESRLQDFFGMKQGPALLGGKVPLTLHLLAPNQRAVQVTTDLAGFWQRVYPELRRELARRYPRHAWPEKPV